MSQARSGGSGDATARRNPAARGADGLALAASPTFALMALLTGVRGGDAMDMLCSAASAAPLNGMVTMYLLMSTFHSTPWLKLVRARA